MNSAYYKLVNEGGEGYTQSAPSKDLSLSVKLDRAQSDLKDAECDGLEYKASQLRIKIAALEAQIAD